MGSIIFLVLLVVYIFSGLHDKVMAKCGFSERDQRLITIGLLTCVVIKNSIDLVNSLFLGSASPFLIIAVVLYSYMIRHHYRRL